MPRHWIITASQAGTYFIQVSAAFNGYDPFDLFLWSWEASQIYTMTVEVGLRAELIDDAGAWSGFSPATVSPGAAFSAWLRIRNTGLVDAGPFEVSCSVYSGSTSYPLGVVSVPNLLAGGTADLQWGPQAWPSSIPPLLKFRVKLSE